MMKRKFVGKKQKKRFSRTADRTHRFNQGGGTVMRGGIRM